MSVSPPSYEISVATDNRTCGWCSDKMSVSARSDAKYCCDQCRYRAAIKSGRQGKVRSVTELKGGRVLVVIYMDETNLKLGQNICVEVVVD